MSDDDKQIVDSSAEFTEEQAATEWEAATARVSGGGLSDAVETKPETEEPKPETEEKPDETESEQAESAEQSADDQAGDDEVDIWANADEAQRAAFHELESKYQDIQHRYKSDEGRVSALQKQINDLQKQLQANDQSNIDQRWKQFKEDLPDEADAIEQMLQQQRQQFENQITSIRREQFFDAVGAAHPDYETTVNSTEFKTWVDTQPSAIREKLTSESAKDAIGLLTMYSDHTTAKKAKAEKIKAERKQRLSESTTVNGSGTAAAADEMPQDLDALWQQTSSKIRSNLGFNQRK